uniref:Uncharacterized protein n=1 Tax=Eptatretus burgeri TaxID=7764 RepID=A0A8C4R4B1_EPTBU
MASALSGILSGSFGFSDVQDDAVGVAVSAPPVEGEANVELLRYVATVLGIRKSGISLYKGSRSRDKVLCIQTGLLNAETSLQRLRQEAEEA